MPDNPRVVVSHFNGVVLCCSCARERAERPDRPRHGTLLRIANQPVSSALCFGRVRSRFRELSKTLVVRRCLGRLLSVSCSNVPILCFRSQATCGDFPMSPCATLQAASSRGIALGICPSIHPSDLSPCHAHFSVVSPLSRLLPHTVVARAADRQLNVLLAGVHSESDPSYQGTCVLCVKQKGAVFFLGRFPSLSPQLSVRAECVSCDDTRARAFWVPVGRARRRADCGPARPAAAPGPATRARQCRGGVLDIRCHLPRVSPCVVCAHSMSASVSAAVNLDVCRAERADSSCVLELFSCAAARSLDRRSVDALASLVLPCPCWQFRHEPDGGRVLRERH